MRAFPDSNFKPWDWEICSATLPPLVDFPPLIPQPINGANVSHVDTKPVIDPGATAFPQEGCMVPGGVPLQGINSHNRISCYNGPVFSAWPVILPPPSVSRFRLPPPAPLLGPEPVEEQAAVCAAVCAAEVGEASKGGGAAVDKNKRVCRWSKEEHMLFLIGIKKQKKGDWRSISRHYVITRSPTQVASHAQKYFSSLKSSKNATGGGSRRKRTSIHDAKHDDVDIVDDPDEVERLKKIVQEQRQRVMGRL